MSDVRICPTCQARAIYKEGKTEGSPTYTAIQDDEALRKVAQLKQAFDKIKARCDELEEELEKGRRLR